MSYVIHHGPPGSYKTSGAVVDLLIDFAKQGRTIVTNIRGLTRDRLFEHLDCAATLDVISLDTTTAADRERLARWFHWVPLGAVIFLDEAQSIWPRSWRDADIRKLDYPGGVDAASAAGRPHDWESAHDMHRHYNWDIVLTTPSIKKIRDDVRGAAEGAFKHKNKGLLKLSIFKGRYVEGWHLADDNGTADGHFMSVTDKRIKDDHVVWKLYDSTATGAHSNTIAGQSIFKNSRVLLLLGVLAVSLSIPAFVGLPDFGSKKALVPVVQPAKTAVSVAPEPPSPVANLRPRSLGGGSSPVNVHPLIEHDISLSGELSNTRKSLALFTVQRPDHSAYTLTSLDLIDQGYVVMRQSYCHSVLQWQGQDINVHCGGAAGAERSLGGVERRQQSNLPDIAPSPLPSGPPPKYEGVVNLT